MNLCACGGCGIGHVCECVGGGCGTDYLCGCGGVVLNTCVTCGCATSQHQGQRAGGVAGVFYCHGQGGNQAFMLTVMNELRTNEDLCLDAWKDTLPADVNLQKCHGGRGNQEWSFEDGIIRQMRGSDRCVTNAS